MLEQPRNTKHRAVGVDAPVHFGHAGVGKMLVTPFHIDGAARSDHATKTEGRIKVEVEILTENPAINVGGFTSNAELRIRFNPPAGRHKVVAQPECTTGHIIAFPLNNRATEQLAEQFKVAAIPAGNAGGAQHVTRLQAGRRVVDNVFLNVEDERREHDAAVDAKFPVAFLKG